MSLSRSPSTLRRLVGASEASLADLGERRDALAAELTATSDHNELAGIGQRLVVVDRELASAEEHWLALSAELEEVEGR